MIVKKDMKKGLLLFLLMASVALTKATPVVLIEQGGWLESGYVTWQKANGLTYNVYVSPASAESWTKLDDELVREYADYGRAEECNLCGPVVRLLCAANGEHTGKRNAKGQ